MVLGRNTQSLILWFISQIKLSKWLTKESIFVDFVDFQKFFNTVDLLNGYNCWNVADVKCGVPQGSNSGSSLIYQLHWWLENQTKWKKTQ